MINLITPGEITIGMIVMGIGSKPYKEQVVDAFGVEREITKNGERSPFWKGVPFEVIGIAGPIILVRASHLPDPSPAMFDTRLVDLVEIDKSFYDTYCEGMKSKA